MIRLNLVHGLGPVMQIAERHEAVVELACGPGMELLPAVKRTAPQFPCMALDANPLVLREWHRYLSTNETVDRLDLAHFSLFEIPFKSRSVSAYSLWLGISSTRSARRESYGRCRKSGEHSHREDGCIPLKMQAMTERA